MKRKLSHCTQGILCIINTQFHNRNHRNQRPSRMMFGGLKGKKKIPTKNSICGKTVLQKRGILRHFHIKKKEKN